jgi:PAS domain S-box-containing protein
MQTLNLRAKFLIGTALLVILLSLAVVVLVRGVLTQKLLAELQDKGVFMAKHLAAASVDHILTENTLASQIMAHDYKSSDANIEYVFFLNSQGEVFGHTFEEGFPIDLMKANSVSSLQTYSVQSLVTEKGRILDIAVPILEGTAGVARVGISEEPIRKSVAKIIRLIVGIVIGVVLVLGGGVAFVFARVITKPVLELSQAVKAVGEGNLGRSVQVRTADEIGQLGATFNAMIEDLQKSRDEIVSAKKYTENILHSMNDTLVVVSPDGNIQAVNAATCSLLGYREAELVGHPAEKIMALKDSPLNGPEFDDLVRKGFIRNAEKIYLSKDGRKIPMLFSGSVMRDNSKIQGIVCAAQDISERKRAEESIRRTHHTQAILNELLQISLENISLEEMSGRIIDRIVSVPWLAVESRGSIFLVEEEPEVLVMKAHRGLPQSLLAICARVPFGRCICGRAAKSGRIEFSDRLDQRHENRYEGIAPHGHYCVPITSAGKVLGVVNLYLREGHQREEEEKEEEFLGAVGNVLAGIIERRRAEEGLTESEKKYRLVVENAGEAIVVTQDGMLKYLNPKTSEISGHSTEELTSTPFAGFVHPDDRKMVIEHHRKTLEGEEEPKIHNFRFIDKNGEARWIENNEVIITWDGRPATLNFLSDITRRKLAEEELIQTTEQLKTEREALERKNVALREILHQIDSEMATLKQQIATNIERTVIPTLLRLKESSGESQARKFELLERDLRQVVSPFLETLKNRYTRLSPRELEVCRLIKEGMTSKEIAAALSLSPTTVQKYRELIRKKLDLVHEGTNLRTYLQSV